MNTTTRRPPLALIVDDHEWSRRSLEGILAPNGFAVMGAYTGWKGLARAREHLPDVICVSLDLPDVDSLELCRTLRRDPAVGARTPIIATSPERVTRERRLAAFQAGAWHLLTFPLDAEDLVLRLETLVRAKVESDRVRDQGLLDSATGVYNMHGLDQRLRELSVRAARQRRALACIIVAPATTPSDANGQAVIADSLVQALRRVARLSDTIGRLGKQEFAVLTPGTTADGAVRLAERIAVELEEFTTGEAGAFPFEIRVGVDGVTNAREMPVRARELLHNADIALRRAKAGRGWLRTFEGAGTE